MFCTACATPNHIAAHYCAECGVNLDAGGNRSMPFGGARSTGRRRRRGRVRGLLARALYLVPVLALLGAGTMVADRYRAERAEQAAWYARAEAAEASGEYVAAIDAYGAAGNYRDADARRRDAVALLAPYRTAYLDGVAALDAGRYDDAIAALVPVARDLPGYEDATFLLAEARRGRETDLLRQADAAEARHDWLAAERALSALLASDPDDERVAARLTALQHAHAPIVFARDHGLYVVSPDLTDERLLTDEVPAYWPTWSPDRTRVAFVGMDLADVTGEADLYVVDAADGEPVRLATQVLPYIWPVWSPDGTKIAYTSLAAFDRLREEGTISIRVVDVATGAETDLTSDRFRQAIYPTWAPTGDRLAFVSRKTYGSGGDGNRTSESDVFVIDLATGEIANVGQGRLPDAFHVTWSPVDDRLLVFTQQRGAWYEPDATGIYLLELSTGTLVDVNTNSQNVGLPVWSPDGTRFAYTEGESVVRVRSQGRGETWINVPCLLSGFLTWSPDGSALIAIAADPKQASVLIPIGAGIGDQKSLQFVYDADLNYAAPPQWSPLNPAKVSGPPSLSGTARDPGGGS